VQKAAFFPVLYLCMVLLIKYFRGVKQPEREVDQSPPPSAEMKNKWSHIVCILLGNSLASEFYMPTFRNTLSVPSS